MVFTSCTKDSVSPASNITSHTKNISDTSSSSAPTTPVNTVPPIVNGNLLGNWTIVSDSCFWAGELPKKLVSAYKGKTGDSFDFSTAGKLYIHEDALSDTPAYSVDTAYDIKVTYADANHFNEAPGFGLALDPVGFNPVIPVQFTQNYVDPNTLILQCSMGTPNGAATRIINLRRSN